MKNGIRIHDSKDVDKVSVVSPTLSSILDEIADGDDFCWAILFIDGVANPDFVQEVAALRKRLPTELKVNWSDLKSIGEKFFQIYELTIIGSKDANRLRQYDSDKDMYESCDVVIELIDCAFWEVFARDSDLIDRLSQKFKDTEIINIDDVA